MYLYIWRVCTRAARKENPNPNPNSHDHCLLSKWKCRTCAYTHLFMTMRYTTLRFIIIITQLDKSPAEKEFTPI